MEATEVKLNWFKKILKFLYFPTIIANLFQSLTMDEKGYSLKKIIACFAVFEGAKISHEHADEHNTVLLVIIWLLFAGICIGIYTLPMIIDAYSKIKNKPPGS